MEELISQFETFSKSVTLIESMLSSCKTQMSGMEQHLLGVTTTEEDKEKLRKLFQNKNSESQKPANPSQPSNSLAPPAMERSISQVQSDEQVIQEALALAQTRRKSLAIESQTVRPEMPRRRTLLREIGSPNAMPVITDSSGRHSILVSKPISQSNSSDIKNSNGNTADPNSSDKSIIGAGSIASNSEKQANTPEKSIPSSLPPPITENSQASPSNPISPEASITPSQYSDRRFSLPKIQMQIELPKPQNPLQQQQQQSAPNANQVPPEGKSANPDAPVVVNMSNNSTPNSLGTAATPAPPVTPGPAPVPLSKGFGRKSVQSMAPAKGWKKMFNNKFFRQPDTSNTTGVSMSMLKLSGDRTEALFYPQSMAIKVWNSVYFTLQLIIVTCIPLCIAYEDTLGAGIYGLTIANSILVAFDTLVKYNTGIMINQQVQMDEIRKYYLRNGSWIFDIITFFPWVFVVDALTPEFSVQRSAARMICMINASVIISVMLRKGRKSYLSEKFIHWARKRGISSSLIDSAKVMVFMIFYWHFNACFTMILRKIKISVATSVYTSEWEHYSAAIFDAAAEMLANGWGSNNPITTQDRWLKVLNMMISATFLALFIGNISAFMIGMDSSGKRFSEILEEVNQYISYKGFGENLRNRILKYYQFKYSGGKYFDENRILNELNQPLRQYIALRECQDLIIKVPFFKDADKYFISQVVMILRVNHYLPGDYVIEEGTTGDHMYFIASGTVEAIVNGISRAKLFPGLFFGEIALLFGRMKRTASIRAVTHCVLYSLSRHDLNSVLELNPIMAEKMKQVAADRLAADAKAKQPPPPPQPEKTAEMSPQK